MSEQRSEVSRKLAHLRRPASYPDRPEAIDTIETHFAWVFLSRLYVYKLKKPVRFAELDLTTLSARRANCELEIALNRRLAAATYIAVVPLGLRGHELTLEDGGEPIEWLVKMHRLPAKQTLEHLLPEIDASDPRLSGLLEKLCRFYRRSPRAPWSGTEYVSRLAEQIRRQADSLTQIDSMRIRAIVSRQLRFLHEQRELLEARVEQGRVRDAHGDLRPEHVFLSADPQIIDCLEFSAELRQLDTAEEISFLELECSKRRRADIARALRGLYTTISDDDANDSLFDFYRSRRALVRAHLSAWHVKADAMAATRRHWLGQAAWYIGAADDSIRRALHLSADP